MRDLPRQRWRRRHLASALLIEPHHGMFVVLSRLAILALRRTISGNDEDPSGDALPPFTLGSLGLPALLDGSSFLISLAADESQVEGP